MLKNISELSEKFTSAEEVRKELKRVQSIKCRLKKQKAREDYEARMKEVLEYEQALKEVRDYFEPKKKPVTQFTWDDVQQLDYEETLKAIKSIQSKKCNVQFLTERLEDNVEYQKACEIERMLLEHKKNIKPIEDTVVRKSEIMNLIDHIENLEPKVDRDYVLELLRKLVQE